MRINGHIMKNKNQTLIELKDFIILKRKNFLSIVEELDFFLAALTYLSNGK